MPLDRNKILRYQVLDRCFRDTSRLYKATDILACCNQELQRYDFKPIRIRTIQNDIQTLQMEPYNIEFDSVLIKSHHYRYSDTAQSLKVLELIDPNRDALLLTIDSLREKYNDPDDQNPQWQWMLLALQAIADNRPLDSNKQYVSFENNEVYAGNVHFATLLECIINQHPATIRYQPYKHPAASEKNIYPYYLKQSNSRWFLFAKIDGNDTISNFALDRIKTVKPWKHPFEPTDIDFATYFNDVIGVTVNSSMAVETVTLRVNAERYPYIETKPFSEKQHIVKRDSKTYIISFPIKINNEFIAKLLSFGNDIEVLHPNHLREEITQKIKEMNAVYASAQKNCV